MKMFKTPPGYHLATPKTGRGLVAGSLDTALGVTSLRQFVLCLFVPSFYIFPVVFEPRKRVLEQWGASSSNLKLGCIYLAPLRLRLIS